MSTTHLRRPALAAALAGAVLAAGCGGGGSDLPTGPATQLPSYLAPYPEQQPKAVYYLQWQKRGDAVDGTLTVAFPTGADVTTRVAPVVGDIDGTDVSLQVGDDAPQAWTGTRAGRKIVFTVELGDGSEQTLRFAPAGLAAYKQAVAEISPARRSRG